MRVSAGLTGAAAALVVGLGTCFAATPSALAQEAEDLTQLERGELIYDELCASCHGSNATGNGPAAQRLQIEPSDLTRIAAVRAGLFPTDSVAAYIDGRLGTPQRGDSGMPDWGNLIASGVPSADERERRIDRAIDDVIAYLRSIQRD